MCTIVTTAPITVAFITLIMYHRTMEKHLTPPKTPLINLENYIFTHSVSPTRAALMMSSVVGVHIGIKPAAAEDFSSEEMQDIDLGDFIELLKPLGLRAVFYHRTYPQGNKLDWFQDIYISRSLNTASNLRQEFETLWNSMDDFGQIIDEPKWQSATRKIGSLLGYPETAVEQFAATTNPNIDDPDRAARMKRHRYYVHTAEHEEQEFESYDLKLNQAIAELAPRTAAELTKNPHKRWLK